MLDDAAIDRYARQIVVPGIGAAGQEKLLHSTVLVVGHPRGCATAKLYLEAAGVRVVTDESMAADAVVAADTSGLARIATPGGPGAWYVVTENGFASGILPAPPQLAGVDDDIGPGAHDAGACAATALACGLLLGLQIDSSRLNVTC